MWVFHSHVCLSYLSHYLAVQIFILVHCWSSGGVETSQGRAEVEESVMCILRVEG